MDYQDDDRPPVVVSSGSVDFDPTTGTFERNGSDKKWKNKGKPTDGKTVRFEVEVTGATCRPLATFGATELTLYAIDANKNVERFVIDIQGGDLNIKSADRTMRQPTKGGKVVMEAPTPMSVIASEGVGKGSVCGLTEDSKVTINQKAK